MMSALKPEHREALDATWERLKKLTERLDRQFLVSQKIERGRQYAVEHPIITLFTLITLAFCTIPLLCFIGFALTTFIVTFVGFLFFEGMLLTIGTVVLGGVLCIVGFLSLGVATFVALAWMSARAGNRLISHIRNHGLPTPSSTPASTLGNGECLKDEGREKDA